MRSYALVLGSELGYSDCLWYIVMPTPYVPMCISPRCCPFSCFPSTLYKASKFSVFICWIHVHNSRFIVTLFPNILPSSPCTRALPLVSGSQLLLPELMPMLSWPATAEVITNLSKWLFAFRQWVAHKCGHVVRARDGSRFPSLLWIMIFVRLQHRLWL